MSNSNLKDSTRPLHTDMKFLRCKCCSGEYPELIYCNIPIYKASDELCPNCFKQKLSQRDLTISEIQVLAKYGLSFCKQVLDCDIDTYFSDCLNSEQLKQVNARIEQLLEGEKAETEKQIKEEYKKKAIKVCKSFDVDPNNEQMLLVTAAILRYVDEKKQ